MIGDDSTVELKKAKKAAAVELEVSGALNLRIFPVGSSRAQAGDLTGDSS